VDLVEGYAMRDHIHMLVMIPPKFSVANTIGFLKGKAAIRIFRGYMQMKRNFTGRHFWAREYCVSMVGLDEWMVREYIRHQESEEKRQEQIRLVGL
jgi:putative transposase